MEWLLLVTVAVVLGIWTLRQKVRSRQVRAKLSAVPASKHGMVIPEADRHYEESEESCATPDPVKNKQAASAFLHDWLSPADIATIRALVQAYGHDEWIWHLHDEDIACLYPNEKKYAILLGPQFGFGMKVRNTLRRAGFGEPELGVEDLRDVYLELLEAAVQE
jgi:hypothetical protein